MSDFKDVFEQKMFYTSNGFEYLESYLTEIYGERGSFKHNLKRFAESDEFCSQSHVINTVDEIREISFQDLQNQVKREEYFHNLADGLIQHYDGLASVGQINDEVNYEAAGIMGLAPGPFNWSETLFPHILDLFVSSPDEGLEIEKSCEQSSNIMSVMVSAMLDGMRNHQIIRSRELNIYSQGYTRNLWRGENAYNYNCYASMYRNRPADPKQAEISDLISTMRMVEFSMWLTKLDFVQFWPYGNILHGAIAQHYGIPTNGIDVTGDIKSAIYFACTTYENGKFRPLNSEEYAEVDSRRNIAERKGDSRYGILFQAPFDIINMSNLVDEPTFHFTSARPIGYQPFMRCGNQNGYLIETGPSFDLYKEPCFSVYKFRLTPEICEWAFDLVDGDDYIYPNEAFGSIDDIIKKTKELQWFSEEAFLRAVKHLGLDKKEQYLRKKVSECGIQIKPKIQLCSPKRKKELEQQFSKNSVSYAESLSGARFRFGFCL